MARTLPHGRFSKTDPGEAFRKAGTIGALGNKGFFGDHLDQFLFEAHGYEHILGDVSQVVSDIATMTWDQAAQRFEDKAGTEVVLTDHDRIAVIGMDTLTDNIVFDNITGLEIFHIGTTPGQGGDNPKFQLGDAGGAEPFKIMLGPDAVDCIFDLQTDKTFDTLLRLPLTQVQRQYVANQGKGNRISVNGNLIYDPSSAGQIVKYDTQPLNPYLLRMDGCLQPFQSNAAVDNLAWFRDLNVALDGQKVNAGSGIFSENQSRYTPTVTLSYLFKLNTANRFFTDISAVDDRIDSRTDPTGVNIALTASFVSGTNVVTFVSATNAKNGMRINGASGQGIPDGGTGTTILQRNNTADGTAQMFDALTGAVVNSSATVGSIPVTLDNSGAAGGSHDADAFQGHRHDPLSPATSFVSNDAVLAVGTAGAADQIDSVSTTGNPVTDTVNNTPRTHSQTQPISSAVYYYYKV